MSDSRTEHIFGMTAEKGRWIFIAAGFLINICLGSVYAYSVFRNPVQTLFGSSTFESGLPFMVFLASFAILMFFGGRLMGPLGPKKVGMIGGILVGSGWILSGILPVAVPSIWTLVFTYGIIGGSGVGLAYGGPIAVATRWFPDRKGLAVGLTIAGFGASPFVTANLARPLIESNGPLNTFMVMGIVFLVVVIALSTLMRFPSADWKPAGFSAARASGVAGPEIESARMVKTSTFWGLFLVYTIGCLAGLMAIGISSPVGTEIIQLDKTMAAAMVGVFALFNGAGRPLFGWLTDRLTPRLAATVSMGVILVASLVMLKAASGAVALYTVCFSALWLCLGGWLAIGPTSTTTFFGAKNYARNYSYVFFGYGIAAILANIISGQSKDLFGSYDVAFMIVAGLAVVGAVLSLTLLKPVKKA
ncbi:MAG: OFA family MFS transporter [Dehalococcoidia bacterium]|nr:OFA family MFS transporter [Dehalococcoidia bacterium]